MHCFVLFYFMVNKNANAFPNLIIQIHNVKKYIFIGLT